jgi:AbrB family looped-hinge helix DNA binding protein
MIVQVKKKAQITIPLKVRKSVGIQEGDLLDVSVKGQAILLRPLPQQRSAIKLLDAGRLKEMEGILSAGGNALKDSKAIHDR